MTVRTGHRVDVLTFEWARELDTGGSGLGLVRSSLPEDDRARWSAELVGRVSVPSGDTEPSTCYLEMHDRAVLLQRMPVRDQLNRESTRTRALIGPRNVVTVQRAIALRPWRVPAEDHAGPYGSYPESWIAASDDDRALAAAARRCRSHAIALVAGLMEERAGADGYLIRPHGADPRALLWAAIQCLGREPWTFSTRESAITASGLPFLVFTDAPASRSSYVARRCSLDLREPSTAARRAVPQATHLVDGALAGRPRRRHRVQATARATARPAEPPPASRQGHLSYEMRVTMLMASSVLFIVLLALAGR
ncbi:hypothetical protein [Actinoplanes sp. NBRC 103695]|uniref:hypothetical protein n=1 Tax=Actinoplanes sp. NBRC 103695 TaxID=3032202 RepID=UPI0024A58602|nr:hypothetical protein [Actinoplanes sp. NBRC 103695]GLY97806.1 hypothetical protein Acsp02_50600 [Actinoplanes sp. NBRC 103695]